MKSFFNNKGMTIPLVLFVLAISAILGISTLFMTDSQTLFNKTDDSAKTALEYAEAGYNKYMWHLNDDVNFYSSGLSKSMLKTEALEDGFLEYKEVPYKDGCYKLMVKKPSSGDRFITIKSTGWSEKTDTKTTLTIKVRKKQFVHQVYVSDNEGSDIWWTTGDECVGPFHTNGDLRIQQRPTFYDTVGYNKSKKLEKGTSYNPDFKIKNPLQPQQVDPLVFPATNSDLKIWAEKSNMLFYGRTCIYLDGDQIWIRNQNETVAAMNARGAIKVSDIKNKVIYVEKPLVGGTTDKFGLQSGNIFISGKLEGTLTIGAANDIYITYDNPTEWYDYEGQSLTTQSDKPNQPPATFRWKDKKDYNYPEKGGIYYNNTTFDISQDKTTRTADGKDMLGLIANRDIKILHYGWPKRALDSDKKDNEWNFKWVWNNNRSKKKYEKSTASSTTYDFAPWDITIHSAIFSVNSGFGFEDYGSGDKKRYINIWGNITQKIRLQVGLVGNKKGYLKNYIHDPRMFYDYPPHILEPANAGWEIHDWKQTD